MSPRAAPTATLRRDDVLPLDGELVVRAGQATDAGAKASNEDCIGLRIPEGTLLTMKGIAAVVADGVSSAEAGREASESCVQGFLSDYFSTPEAWSVKRSAAAVLTAQNRWLYGQGHGVFEAHKGYVTTFSALILKSRTAHVVHVGDTRVQLLRDGRLERLTRDHVTSISDDETYLSRALGMDVRLEADYRSIELHAGDVFLLTSDGVHDHLSEERLVAELETAFAPGEEAERLCRRLLDLARSAGSDDNLSCQIIVVDALPAQNADDLYSRLQDIRFPPPLEPGMRLDGYVVEKEIHASSRSQLYLVREESSGRRLVMKTPSVNYEDDVAYIERFIMEPWIGRRIDSPYVVDIVEPERPPTFLYYLMEYVEGPSLVEWMRAHPEPDIADTVELVEQIEAGLQAFHRRETLHQDLKPANVIVGRDGRIRIVDFGSCHVAGIQEIATPIERETALGTATYSAPETRWGRSVGVRSDLFSLGSVAYEMLTGQLPYGEAIDRVDDPRKLDALEYVPSYHRNPMIPVWIDGALRCAVATDPRRRYAELSAFVYDLRHPNPVYLRDGVRPLIERDPVTFWKGVSAILAAALLVTLFLLMR